MKHGKTLNSKKHLKTNQLVIRLSNDRESFFTLEKQKRLRNSTFFSFHPEGIEPPSQEPESYVISITLRVATVIVYQIFKYITSKKSLPKGKL